MHENLENAVMLACLYTLKDKVTRFIHPHKNGYMISMDSEGHIVKVFYHDKSVHTHSVSDEQMKYGQQAIFQYHLETPMRDKLHAY